MFWVKSPLCGADDVCCVTCLVCLLYRWLCTLIILWGIGQSMWYGTSMCAVEQIWILWIDYLHYGASLCNYGQFGVYRKLLWVLIGMVWYNPMPCRLFLGHLKCFVLYGQCNQWWVSVLSSMIYRMQLNGMSLCMNVSVSHVCLFIAMCV